jgi:hypothetical protein
MDAQGPPPFRPRDVLPRQQAHEAAAVHRCVPGCIHDARGRTILEPEWTHHGPEDAPDPQHDPQHPPPLEAVPLVINSSRLRTTPVEQYLAYHSLIGGAPDSATAEARLKQREYEQRDSLDVPDDELFVTRPGWVEEQDRRYVEQSQNAWARMHHTDVAREAFLREQARAAQGSAAAAAATTPPLAPQGKKDPKAIRAARRKAAKLQQRQERKNKVALFPAPSADDMKVIRNK